MRLGSVLLGLALFTAACSAGDPSAPLAGEVKIENFLFKPEELTVSTGTVVTWQNGDEILHTATSGTPDEQNGLFDGTMATKGERFEYTFAAPGTFTYFCSRHPHMTGTIRVTS